MPNNIEEALRNLLLVKKHRPLIIAIEGRCASGKTTLAEKISRKLDANIIHMDHFFLTPEMRTKDRENEPGGNVDYERVRLLLASIKEHQPFSYQPYDCHTQKKQKALIFEPKDLMIVEGSYSAHPRLIDYYDLTIFSDVDPQLQKERILQRNGAEQLKIFLEKWIPLEEDYFRTFGLQKQCDIYYNINERR